MLTLDVFLYLLHFIYWDGFLLWARNSKILLAYPICQGIRSNISASCLLGRPTYILAFSWVLNLVLTLVWQTLYPLSHLSSDRLIFKRYVIYFNFYQKKMTNMGHKNGEEHGVVTLGLFGCKFKWVREQNRQYSKRKYRWIRIFWFIFRSTFLFIGNAD